MKRFLFLSCLFLYLVLSGCERKTELGFDQADGGNRELFDAGDSEENIVFESTIHEDAGIHQERWVNYTILEDGSCLVES